MGCAVPVPRTMTDSVFRKVARLVDYVESSVRPGHPEEILTHCELFARDRGQWLKVAGHEKAEIIQSCWSGRPFLSHNVALEFGVFVGYTLVRLGAMSARKHVAVVSLEVSPVHVCIARHFLNLACLAHAAEVYPGQAKDAMPLVNEELGEGSVCFSFMDHRGTIFHFDAALMERLLLPAAAGWHLADNTLNPGSPEFMWERFAPLSSWTALPLSVTEFQAEHEDWTTVCEKRPAHQK